jgi:predicted XRE-type DNA-binding protein
MSKKRFANVWDAIENTPAQAENMKLRSTLMMALKDHIARTGLSQSEAAKLLGVTQPRISDLMRGKIELFGLDTLVNMIGAAGLHVEMRTPIAPSCDSIARQASVASWQVNALVEATPISGPASVGNTIWLARAIVELGTSTTESARCPWALANSSEASVSAVSPDCDTKIARLPASSGTSRYRNSDATSISAGRPA